MTTQTRKRLNRFGLTSEELVALGWVIGFIILGVINDILFTEWDYGLYGVLK